MEHPCLWRHLENIHSPREFLDKDKVKEKVSYPRYLRRLDFHGCLCHWDLSETQIKTSIRVANSNLLPLSRELVNRTISIITRKMSAKISDMILAGQPVALTLDH